MPRRAWAVGSFLFAVTLVPAYAVNATVYLTPAQAEERLLPAHDTVRKVYLRPTPEQRARLEAELGSAPPRPRYIWRVAERRGQPVGYLLIDNEFGKHEPITFAVALDGAGAVQAVAICVYRESRGGEVRRASFMKQFRGKRHGDRLRLGAEVTHVSGATISSRSAVNVVNRALALWALEFGSRDAHANAVND